jgi:hypothetical protein
MNKEQVIAEAKANGLAVVERVDFEHVDNVYFALIESFHPEGIKDDIDERFISVWQHFLISAGWTDDEFWAESEIRQGEDRCPDCGNLMDDHEDDDEIEELPPLDKNVAPELKPN